MSMLARPDEVELFAVLRIVQPLPEEPVQVCDYVSALDIPYNRARYIFRKWETKGWWCGRNELDGMFCQEAPAVHPAASISVVTATRDPGVIVRDVREMAARELCEAKAEAQARHVAFFEHLAAKGVSV